MSRASLIEMRHRPGRGVIATAFAVAALALGCVAASSGADPRDARGAALKLARVGGFNSPVYVEDAPGAKQLLFVVEQPGTIRVVRKGETLKRAFLDLSDRVLYGGEQGLLSVAFDPEYARTRRFYVYYVNKDGNIEVDGYRRKRKVATRADAGSRRTVIEVPHPQFPNHNGGQLQFGRDGFLYLGTGDGGAAGDPHGNAQNPEVLLGKLLRIDPRKKGGYAVPDSNPYVGRAGQDEIYALGLRNPYRFSFDSRGGDIYIGDVGQDSWEEVDHVGLGNLRGSNFGWDIFEGDPRLRGRRGARQLPTPGGRVQLQRQQLRGHGRLRRARSLAAGALRPLSVRRLLRRPAALVRSIEPGRQRRSDRPRRRPAELVRRGPRRAHLRRLARRSRLPDRPALGPREYCPQRTRCGQI